MIDDRTPEQWRPVVGHEGYYEVSDEGRVRGVERLARKRNGGTYAVKAKLLKLTPTSQGYVRVTLARDGVLRYARVHTLVLEAFVGPCPSGHEALHKDDIGANNALRNLRWGTSTENTFDCIGNSNHQYAKRDRCSRKHLFAGANLITRSDGGRRCRSCRHAEDLAKERRRRGLQEPDRAQVADEFYRTLMHVE